MTTPPRLRRPPKTVDGSSPQPCPAETFQNTTQLVVVGNATTCSNCSVFSAGTSTANSPGNVNCPYIAPGYQATVSGGVFTGAAPCPVDTFQNATTYYNASSCSAW